MRAPWRAAPARQWSLVAGASLLACAWWLRDPEVRYLLIAGAATVAALVLTIRLALGSRRWGSAFTATVMLFLVVAGVAQRELHSIASGWEQYRAERMARGLALLQRELADAAARLERDAARALDAPAAPADAFASLERLTSGHVADAVLLYRGSRAVAWAGRSYAPTDSLSGAIGSATSAFYVVLFATAERNGARTIASTVVDAQPPADRVVAAIGDVVARETKLHAFEFLPPHDASARGLPVFKVGRDTLFAIHVVPPGREEAQYLALERVRAAGATLLAVALICYLVGVWRIEQRFAWRLVPLGVALGVLLLAPLSMFSSASVLFDPTVYYAEAGGALTASIGALAVAATIVLLALLLALRAHVRLPARPLALVVVLSVITFGPTLLRVLSRGIAPPPTGVSDTLWLSWEVALFLAAAALLVAAAAAGAAALKPGQGLPPWLAPSLAIAAAALGRLVLQPEGGWPVWYSVLWMLAIGTLALTRAHRRTVLSACTVAALGAATLTWNAGVQGRIALAERDVESLGTPDSTITGALERLGTVVADEPPPIDEADLLKVYMASDLVETGFPVQLASWSSDGAPQASVSLAPMLLPAADLTALVQTARESGRRVLTAVPGIPGVFQILVVPHPSGAATSVVVAPRTRLIPDDPYLSLIGLEPRSRTRPPYSIALVETVANEQLVPGQTRWYRDADELHGDRLVVTPRGPMRAHIEIELRSPAILIPSGVLVVMLDLLLTLVLWSLSVMSAGALGRWLRARRRQWSVSYRSRLTIALFAFFVAPAAGFAVWGYERLRTEDRQSRDLLLRESLRTASAEASQQHLEEPPSEPRTPLFLYRDGELWQTSDALFDAVAPVGRWIPAAGALPLGVAREEYSSATEQVGETRALFGFRSVSEVPGEALVLGAPARGYESLLDQRRRDLGVLLMFATVVGAVAALGLSRVASRSLAQPINTLRRAALAIAAGEREPPLTTEPPYEFGPVFAAFRRMAADLSASRQALESVQRRTAAVLRNVASGVVALADDGTITLANPPAEALFGQALPAGTAIRIVQADIAQRLASFLASEADEEQFELALDGRQLQARLTRLAAGAVLTVDDVTELARAQRVLAWGEMARQVAHEIKNPLTPIRLGVQHLRRAFGNPRGDYAQILERNAERILSEIDRLDSIARGFSRYGMPAERREATSLVDVVAVTRDVVELERMGRDDVEWEVHDGLPNALALAREDELREVLLNVLENARQAGARHVAVRVDRSNGRVRLAVSDDGPGVPAHLLPRLFEPHFSTRTSGSGLGLAISRQLVESWGGAIAIESEQGKGTTVVIELLVDGT